MNKYICTDGNAELEVEAESAQDAAQQWVDSGDWGEREKTIWIDVRVTEDGSEDGEQITVTLDPIEPECDGEHGHDWQSPISVVGGIKENPGVYGHGGGVTITQVCCHCGKYRVTDTWAQRPDTGEQGLESTEYRDSDETSEAGIAGLVEV